MTTLKTWLKGLNNHQFAILILCSIIAGCAAIIWMAAKASFLLVILVLLAFLSFLYFCIYNIVTLERNNK